VGIADRILASERALCRALAELRFAAPVTHVYNPLEYARRPHAAYVRRYARAPVRLLFFGMNPGPFGMAQTGVPFGDVRMVREWMGISEKVERPAGEHPKRPVLGFDCGRSEVSGSRLWGWARDRFGTPDAFFARFFVLNYCPLCFMLDSCANLTPDKLAAAERQPLFEACDEALRESIAILKPRLVVGVGAFAEKRARIALAGTNATIGCILHPSPASPKANAGWAAIVEQELAALGVRLDS